MLCFARAIALAGLSDYKNDVAMPLNLFGGIRPVEPKRALRDLLAGVNLASINIPQVLGYSRIAGTTVVSGLYTLLLPPIAFAIFGSSRHLVVAADSATAAIFSGSLSRLAAPASEQYMMLVCTVALLTAALLLVARIFKLGFLADFLSRTVLTGFLAGVGVQVGIAMLSDMFGVAAQSRYSLVRVWQIMDGLPHLHYPTLALSTLVAGSILLGNRFAPRLPLVAHRGGLGDCLKRDISLRGAGHRAGRPDRRRLADVPPPQGDLERDSRGAAHIRVVHGDDHRAKRGNLQSIRNSLSRERGRGRGHSRSVGRECRRRR